jgi:hypothetical protein
MFKSGKQKVMQGIDEQISYVKQEKAVCLKAYQDLLTEFGEKRIVLFSKSLLQEIRMYRSILSSLQKLKQLQNAKN